MSEIIALLVCLEAQLSASTMRQLRQIAQAFLCIPNRATMLALARWSEKGGSYRSLQRFYQTPVNWLLLHWILLKTWLLRSDGLYLLAGDEVVVSKSGKKTHGLGRFYSSIAQRAIPSLSFFAISVIAVETRQSYPLQIEQLMPSPPQEKPKQAKLKGPRGRPKGSKNHAKAVPPLTPTLALLQKSLAGLKTQIRTLAAKHLVLDGKFGNAPSIGVVRETGLHLISKLRHDAALYLAFTGAKPPRGPTARYGAKLNLAQLPQTMRLTEQLEGNYRVEIYQMQVYQKEYPELLNVVVIRKTELKTGKVAQVLLFSTDLSLTATQIIDYYSLRFQIEFNFRDAKQYWGLEDFMNVSPQAVTNAVNLAFFMVNVSEVLLKPYRQHDPQFSVLDLKAQFRAQRYLSETIKLLPVSPEPHLISRIWQRLTRFGAIRTRPSHDFAP
jgi:DDE superfamily endonuclease